MGMIEIEIEFNELRKRNIVRFDRNDDWHPYLLVNTDRAYFDLNGNKISVLSRDFSLCRDMAQVKRELLEPATPEKRICRSAKNLPDSS